jgi:hypothetical protein
VLKKAIQAATAFGVLLAGYAGYVRVFALVAQAVGRDVRGAVVLHEKTESKSMRDAINEAIRGFGKDHWAASEGRLIRIYNAERGFYMYARDYKRLEDGKQVELTPFAIIWPSRDGRALKTAVSDVARFDLDQPFGLVGKPGASSNFRIVHARLEGNVVLRDDKGTRDTADDMKMALTYIEYDEAKLRIESESDLVIEDNIYRITGQGLRINLRPREAVQIPGAATGFNGAQTAFINKNVDILISDVGPNGILPGNPSVAAKPGEKTPLHLRCDGVMQIDLPEPRVQPKVGPPAPQGPTFAQFFRNVEVLRGKAGTVPDQLNCDHLRLVLIQALKKTAAQDEDDLDVDPENAVVEDSATNLTLKRAEASGHNVRLFSAAQGVKARCNELIHKKQFPEMPDETYLRGDSTTRLVVDKVDVATDGPDKGKVTGFTTIRTIDATIFDDGSGNANARIVARGPGDLEARPAQDKPVERTARWDDTLILRPEAPTNAPKKTAAGGAPAPLNKRIELTGNPSFSDLKSQATLDARRIMVIWLRPKPQPPAPAPVASSAKPASRAGTAPAPAPAPGGASFDLEKLVAIGDVHLTSPGKFLTARERLDAVFEAVAPATTPSAPPAARTVAAAAPATTPPARTAVAAADPKAAPAAVAPVLVKPAEPDSRAIANKVWASVRLLPAAVASTTTSAPAPAGGGLLGGQPGSSHQAELDEVRLRGAVTYHQDPAVGKLRGTDVVGEAVDLINKGENRNRFIVYSVDGTTQLSDLDADLAPLAKVETEDLTVWGQKIGLDQTTDEAWVDGRGRARQMAASGLLSDKGLEPPAKDKDKAVVKDKTKAAPAPAPVAAPAKKSPMTITFAGGMKFFGRSTNMKGQPAARAEFYKDVHAETDDSSLDCEDVMRTYFDQLVKLNRPKRDPMAEPDDNDENEEPKPQIAVIECVKRVVVVNRKVDPASNAILQKERIEGEYLVYEKATGRFRVPGEGQVYLYEREGKNNSLGGPKIGANDDGRDVILTSGAEAGASGLTSRSSARPAAGRAPAVVGRNSNSNGNSLRNPADTATDRTRQRVTVPAATAPGTGTAAGKEALRPLVLTEVLFTRGMYGRFGTGKDSDKTEVRYADFFGDVQAHHARVPNGDTLLDPDKLPADAKSMTSQVLRVVSEPTRPEAGQTGDPPPRYLLRAWENAFALTGDKTIQADTITYDSLFDLFYAYGEEGRDVLIGQQEHIGQPSTVAQGTAVRFNAKTGESELIDPKTVALVDVRTGYRPVAAKAPDTKTKPRRQPRTQFRNLRGSIERKGFQ